MWWTASFEEQWVVSLIPAQSSTAWEAVLETVDAGLTARDPVRLIPASRSDSQVPLAWLPYLAEERSVDEFDSSWPEARRRTVTRDSLGIHQVKGTRPALDRALAAVGYSTTVVEWFEVEPRRLPYTFRLSFVIDDDRTWWESDALSMVRTANKAKNAHTKLEAIEPRRNASPAVMHVGGLMKYAETIRIGSLPELETIRIHAAVHVGAVVRLVQTLRIQPRT